MQRYSTASCGGVGNNTIGGGSSLRDGTRVDSSFTSSNFSLNSRRPSQLAPYKLKCEKESLNCRLGPPDFFPQTPNCPEETLTREYLLSGYKETVDGIEEAKEIVLSQVGILTRPVTSKCKEAIRKHLRSINESRAQKRKAGQSYGVPLSGQLIVKPQLFPELRSCGEDSRKKWIEALSQHHKGLRSLADHIPHGFRKKVLLEVIVRHNVPLLRATWFIKVTYLNQIRPNSGGISSAAPDKSQATRTELWTKDISDYLQYLLDDLLVKNGFPSNSVRDQASPNLLSSIPSLPRTDLVQSFADGNEPPLQFKWRYVISLVKWHFAEGLLSPSLIIEWALFQLQEKESVEALELLLPIIMDLMDTLVQSQTYVRMFVDLAIHLLQDLSPGGVDAISNSKKPHLAAALVETLRYFLLAVPDTLVTLDCFPLPVIVAPDMLNAKQIGMTLEKSSSSKILEGTDTKDHGSQDAYCRYLSFGHVASSLQQRALNLAKMVNPSPQGHGAAKRLQALDKALVSGDIKGAYVYLFEDPPDVATDDNWFAEVSPCLRSSLKWVGAGNTSIISAVFFLLEWATCDFRDYRAYKPPDVKFTGRKYFSQVYVAVLLLKLRLENMPGLSQLKVCNTSVPGMSVKGASPRESLPSSTPGESASLIKCSSYRSKSYDILESPGELHDIVVCWLDQHEVGKGEGFKRLEVLMMELIRYGIFCPLAYVRQLIVSGIMDRTEMICDLERQKRHLRILKQFPGSYLLDILEESEFAEASHLRDAVHIFSNERKLVLDGVSVGLSVDAKTGVNGSLHFNSEKFLQKSAIAREVASPSLLGKRKNHNRSSQSFFAKQTKTKVHVAELKLSIAALLCLPHPYCSTTKTRRTEVQGASKKGSESLDMKFDLVEGKSGCEECSRAKRQKLTDEKISMFSGILPNQSDDDDTWWMRKEVKSSESFKEEQPSKSTKSNSRGRQKLVRKTQSLAQLAAARIEGSQGTSTSHVCESKSFCTHHMPNSFGENLLAVDGLKMVQIANVGKAIKKLRWLEKRSITIWLLRSIKQLVEVNERALQPSASLNEERSVVRWKFREDALSSILYLLDISFDLYLAAKLLIWLLPRVPNGSPSVHVGRTAASLPKNNENHVIDVGEAFVVAALQRYENTLLVMDLLPEVLTAAMHRSAVIISSNGRASGSLAFIYARNILRRYGKLNSLLRWEKNFRSTCDQRLLAELETGRPLDVEFAYSLGVPSGVEDVDDFLRQKISGRISRAGQTMREIVQKHVEEALYGKERKVYGPTGTVKYPNTDKLDDVYQLAQQIVMNLLDCIRQNRGATQEWDPSLIATAVSAVVGNVGPACSNYQNFSSNSNLLNNIQQIVRVHLTCLCLLKEAFGERMNRVFEIALAIEASSNISNALSPVKSQRGQFQLSPEINDMNQNSPNDANTFSKMMSGRSFKAPAAVSALVIGAIAHGITSLEKMITAFRLKEGLDFMQFFRSARSSANGISRSSVNSKLDQSVEVHLHWFRLLIGNYRSVLDGLVVDILGESYTLALSRMQRMLPLSVAFPLAYSVFAMVIWRPYVSSGNIVAREDIQLYQSLLVAIGDLIRHQPFRDLCLRDSQCLLDLMACDVTEAEFAAIIEPHSPDKHFKIMAFVPLRARLFLNAIVDCRMPSFTLTQEDGSWLSGRAEPRRSESEGKLVDQLVHVLDTLQPAKFHWQWLELRLLLNEQALIEKIETHSMSLVEAIRSLSPTAENFSLSEDESTFTEIVLTRLLVRPDAASLYSEVFHLLGRSLEEKLLLNVKWLLSGTDVLYGRKTVRQRLVSVAQLKGLSTKLQYWKPWSWSRSVLDVSTSRDEKRKMEASSLEEGEVVEDGHDSKKFGKPTFQSFEGEGANNTQQHVMDKPLLELVLPCIDRSSTESRNMFAAEMIKQLSSIDQHINSLTRGSNKQVGAASGIEGSAKGSNRKGMRGGSPGLGRRPTGSKDSSPPSIAALRASLWLRLQFLLRMLPVIYADREQSTRNSKHIFASVLLHLLGSPVVYESLDISHIPSQRASSRRDLELIMEASVRPPLDVSGDNLFDITLSVFHGLLSGSRPGWMKSRSISKSTIKSPRDLSPVDRELVEHLQADLDRMQLPATIRWRLQAAMPVLPPSSLLSISSQPPIVSSKFLSSLYPLFSTSGNQDTNASTPQRSAPSVRPASNASGKNKQPLLVDSEIEIDPWTLLEDGTGSISPSVGGLGGASSDQSNLKACYWLKGAVRARRADITYVGAMDEDS